MCQCKLCVLCALLCFSVYPVTTFNVDSFNYASYEGGPNAMFGFSLALHRERNNGWLIVGAPEAQSSQPGVIRGGVVYRCPTMRDGGCEEIPFDPNGHNRDKNNILMDNKTEQWFGATVSSSGRPEGPIVACAPRYTWFPRSSRRDPVGTCYVSNGFFADFNEYSPCRTYQWGYHRQGSCQAGFSAAINSVGDRLFIGSPGSWYWQGQMYSVDAHATFEFKPTIFSATYGHEGQVHQQSLETRPAVFSTTEGTEKDDDSYMGYSTIVGDFQGNGEEGIAVGMPRGNNLKGKVLLFTWNLTNFLHHFASDQIGSYYGYALAASDVDGDSKLDLIVGAPMYTVQNNKNKYDVGRVYVIYHQSEKGRFAESYIIDGFNSKSRFGQALASLGDINQDGFGDFAVGAPYDGKDNRGAVYIYHGSSKGVRKKFSQVILAEDIIPLPTGALTTFGFSITGGLDLDGNQYPDMAVGAYLSNKAFFFRSRPVIKVEASVKFLAEEVDIENTDYTLKSGKEATKTQIQFCSRYYGKGIPSSLILGVEYILDTKKLINPRMGFVEDEGQNRKNTTVTLLRDEQVKCAPPVDVYVRSDIRDKLTSLVVEAKYWLKDDADLTPAYLQQLPRDPRATLIPVLDLNSPPSKKDSISIQKNCGDDDVCIPNLVLTVEPSVQEYSLDSGEQFYLEIVVANSAEDAFETTVEVKYPDGFYFSTAADVQVISHVLCSSLENNTITCDIGNPVPHNSIVRFKLLWQPDLTKELSSRLRFNVSVNSTNEEPEETREDNQRTVEISIHYDIIEDIKGWSSPNEVVFSPASSLYIDDISNQTRNTPSVDRLSEDVIGPQVIHVYTLTNKGQTTINETEIFFVWPSLTSTDEDFLYLLEPPHFLNTENLNLKCGTIPHNHRDFELTRRKSIWEVIPKSILPQDDVTQKDKLETSRPVGSTKGGYIVTDNPELNQAVDKGSETVKDLRHQNKTETMSRRVQIFEEGAQIESANLKRLQFGGKNYVYRCIRTVSGTEEEVDCGGEISVQNIPRLLQQTSGQYQEEGNVQYWCLQQDSSGNWKKVACGKTPTVTEKKDTVVQIFHAGEDVNTRLQTGKYRHQKINGSDFVYRCFRQRNGKKEEIECGQNLKFSSIDIPWALQHSGVLQDEGNIKFACLKLDAKGNLQSTPCVNVPKIKIKTEIFKSSWGLNNTHYWNDSGVYYVGDNRDLKIQILEGGNEIQQEIEGKFLTQIINGRLFIYRCFRARYGIQEEVNCGRDLPFSSIDISRVLERSSSEVNGVRYICLEFDSRGNLRSTSCGTIPEIRFKTSFSRVQVLLGSDDTREHLEGGLYRHQVINGRDFIYRCFRRYNGREEEIDCGENFSLSRINIAALLEREGIPLGEVRYICLEPYGGTLQAVDCGGVPQIRFKTQIIRTFWKSNGTHYWNNTGVFRLKVRYDFETVQVLQGGESTMSQLVGSYRLERVGGQEFLYRCFRDTQQIDCGSTFTLAGINILVLIRRAAFHREGDIRYCCLKMDVDTEEWESGDCSSLPKIQTRISYEGTARKVLRRCLRLVDGQWMDVDCSSDVRFRGSGTFVEDCFQTINGRSERIDCKNVPAGTIFEDVYPGGTSRRNPHTYGQESGLKTSILDLGSLEEDQSRYNDIGDNVPTSSPSSKRWTHGRRKRQIIADSHPSINEIQKQYPCENLKCVYMRCTLNNLQHEKPIVVALRGRLNAKVLRSMKLDSGMEFSSMMLARVHKVPHLRTIEDSKIAVQEVETVVKTPEEIKSETVPLWVVVLSAVAGTIILLLIIFLLYKLGFFKRNRPSTAPERQPLNRNGYHHGDEAL